MGFLNKLLGGSGSKLSGKLRQAEKLLNAGKLDDLKGLTNTLWNERGEETTEDELNSIIELRLELCESLFNSDRNDEGLELAVELIEHDDSHVTKLADVVSKKNLLDPRALNMILASVEKDPKEKRLLINVAKNLLENRGDNLSEDDLQFVTQTAISFPLWKEGQGMLADMYLNDNRRDAAALTIYRNAYPNRKADKRLREVLLESLILNEEVDEFAASVYKDTVETSDNVEALKLLVEYYIKEKQFSPATLPYIERAMEKTEISQDALAELTKFALNKDEAFGNVGELLLAIYRQGYSDRDMLAFLGEYLAQANKFDNESIEIMTKAFELRMVSKRAILILTEHCLANDREDTFSIKVYESYLSTWPDRPQRRIYNILAHHYGNQTRVDEQAQKIYEEALEDSPTDPLILTILARAYRAMDRRDENAEDIYRHAFPIATGDAKQELALILAEMRVNAGDFSEETLQYLTVMGRPDKGPLKGNYDQALTNCFLAAGRRGEQAQLAYFSLFEHTENTTDLNPRLVELLADIIKERMVVPGTNSVEMRVYRKLFELKKFSTDAEISFILLHDSLDLPSPPVNLNNLIVRCFEADKEKCVEVLKEHDQEKKLQEIGDFYIEHFNFPQAASAYQVCYKLNQTDELRYRLSKIHLLENRADLAIELLSQLDAAEFANRRKYWEVAAYQQMGDLERANSVLHSIPTNGEVPAFLVNLREAIGLELAWESNKQDQTPLDKSLAAYNQLLKEARAEYKTFERWLQLEQGIVLIKLGRINEACVFLEEIHRHNPNGRAEQIFFSLALFLRGWKALQDSNAIVDNALPLFTRAVEVNRNHRELRQVIVDLLSLYGEQAFFNNQLEKSAKILEVANRILPKQVEVKTYLAYAYHRLKDYQKAILFYRDITWGDEGNPRMERSHAYAYLANRQPERAWRIFLDLARSGNMLNENFPRVVSCVLADPEAEGSRFWEPVEFDPSVDGRMLVALLIHDGLYERAVAKLDELIKEDPTNPSLRWYLGKAYSRMGKREMAVFNWLELIKLVEQSSVSPEMKIRQFTEIGMAFLAAGYAQEAMQTWEHLRKLDEKNTNLPVLYAATLDLNALQLARKDQNKLAREEWKKALAYDQDNAEILQNFAIINLLMDDYDTASKHILRVSRIWQQKLKTDRQANAHLEESIQQLENAMNTIELTKGRSDHDLTKVRAEDIINYYQKANQFYWILGLDKNATAERIEIEYFRLIKIFNPERHADDFMLVEEAYSNLFADQRRRALIDLFVFNPVCVDTVRNRLTRLPKDGQISFEQLALPNTVPPPDFQQLTPPSASEDELVGPLMDLLKINFKIPDWTVL